MVIEKFFSNLFLAIALLAIASLIVESFQAWWRRRYPRKILVSKIAMVDPEVVARQLLSVQPMDDAGKAFNEIYEILDQNRDKSLRITTSPG